ncbi:hypothetical protein MUB04_15950 [Acinetobacter indicus]|uniref:hypothetical protein n=1 Tax=Acinetobacter TaxID=469 RepID=UPI0015D19D80|nr:MULTISPECIES: hypothetical protein [Acinetobacter]MCP0918032.1 hypothetical protein [Acinetobacter indicus]
MNEDQYKIDGYKRSIRFGKDSPYDRNEDNEMPKPLTPERIAAYGVLNNLMDRSGIRSALEDIDLDIREEIVESLAGIIKEAMK